MKEVYEKAINKLASELLEEISKAEVIGLGSGSTVSSLIRKINLAEKKLCVPTSRQIGLVAEQLGMICTELHGEVDLTIDGADQVDRELNMIKGGGGALLREKILINFSKKVYIVVSDEKVAGKLCEKDVPVPVEISPFGINYIKKKLFDMNGRPELRINEKGYPYFTENCNMILDTYFKPVERPAELEASIKRIPGVVEVGIFTKKPDKVFVLEKEGSYTVMK